MTASSSRVCSVPEVIVARRSFGSRRRSDTATPVSAVTACGAAQRGRPPERVVGAGGRRRYWFVRVIHATTVTSESDDSLWHRHHIRVTDRPNGRPGSETADEQCDVDGRSRCRRGVGGRERGPRGRPARRRSGVLGAVVGSVGLSAAVARRCRDGAAASRPGARSARGVEHRGDRAAVLGGRRRPLLPDPVRRAGRLDGVVVRRPVARLLSRVLRGNGAAGPGRHPAFPRQHVARRHRRRPGLRGAECPGSRRAAHRTAGPTSSCCSPTPSRT